MGFPLRLTGGGELEERAEDLDSSQGVRDPLVAYHLAPAITDFISDENRLCCNNDLEQTLTLLHSEWSKEIEPSGQSSTHHPLVVSNPIDKKGSEAMRRSMRWDSMPTAACDPCNQAHGRDNKASKTTSRTRLQRAPNTKHTARSTACCLDSLGPQDDPWPCFI